MTETYKTFKNKLKEIHQLLKIIPSLSYEDMKELENRTPGEDINFDHAINLGISLLAGKILLILGDSSGLKEALNKFIEEKQ